MSIMRDAPRNGLETAFELADFAARMVETKFRRENPDATDEQVRAAVGAWWADRPGAPDGDSPGRLVTLPR
jgi:hypothetical protein